MGRELKRVPLDFDWPRGQIWKGYLNPYRSIECNTCKGTGESPEARALSDRWYGWDREPKWAWCDRTYTRRWNKNAWNNNLSKRDVQALLDADRLWDFTRIPMNSVQTEIVRRKIASGGNSWLPRPNGSTPTPEEVNRWNRHGFGHDSINKWEVIQARLKREGLPLDCPACNGEGCFWHSSEIQALHEAWERQEPPTGEGYQLWETTTEGSPDSPVFATLDELCTWCEANATTFADYKATAQEWIHMLSDNFVSHQEGNVIFV